MLRWPASPMGWAPSVRPAHTPLAHWRGHGRMSSHGRRTGLQLSVTALLLGRSQRVALSRVSVTVF